MSCKSQMSALHLDITSTTSFDQPLIVPTFHEHTLKFWCDNWLTIWQCSHLTLTLPLEIPWTWWILASLSHWTALKMVILYIVAKFYSWMDSLTPNCNSQGKPGDFPETPSHQIIEFLKHSTKSLYNLLYIHHQGHASFCRAAHIRPIVRASLAALALPVVTMGT